MKYTSEDVKVTVGGVELVGYPVEDLIYASPKRLWYKDVKGKPFTVIITCQDWTMVEVPFNELGYEKHIKPMEPTAESPFKVSVK